ncbi:dynamin family protein [Campylobacter sp. RM16187]|uniref:dynamin family protein n=1 Tax=Campylobacter sp. RM16187 TaxID=1660063 RepID=UPI0021B5172C|nr:dynamin family protein [Campylobacter sp. RM16187]QKG29784.1 GTP-binding protein (dynamin domain) [Campylobacter sp. RM16187]
MLEKFISSYKMTYFKIFGDDFYGRFKAYENALLEPKFHPSSELKDELRKLDLFLSEPVQIAIVGQFSSGKSTFLNALLGFDILPTGVTPVTARLTRIKYGENFSLRVDYKNGKELSLNVNEIAKFVDQRVYSDEVKELCIYAPNPILKLVNFIDTPGLNSLSSSDTNITKEVLDSVSSVIWLSLIENAARASELNDLQEFLQNTGKTAICVLNQKDKLGEIELENVLSHAKITFDGIFEEIIAISAKQANLARKNQDENLMLVSNFKSVLDAIDRHFTSEKIKKKFVLKKCESILAQSINQHEYFCEIYEKAKEVVTKFDFELDAKLERIKNKFKPKTETAFNEIKEISKFISDEILSSLKPKKKYKFISKKSLLKGDIYERQEYEMMSFDSDEIFSKLIYNDVKLSKFFRIYRRNLSMLEDELKAEIDEIYKNLEREFLIYKSEFENIIKEISIHSDTEFATIRTYAGQIYRLILRDFETVKFNKLQKLSLFFEKLNLKVVANYENAIKIAVHFIKDKIENSAIAYEKDPLHFALFIPTSVETFDRVLISLNLYEFENEMLSNSSFLNKIINELRMEFGEIKEAKIEQLNSLSNKHKALKSELENLSLSFDCD